LARVVKDRVRRLGRSLFEVRVTEHDVGALAAQLQGDALDLCRAPFHDDPPDRVGSGEADLAHRGMRDESVSHHRAVSRDDLEHPFGDTGLEREFAEANGGERREDGGL